MENEVVGVHPRTLFALSRFGILLSAPVSLDSSNLSGMSFLESRMTRSARSRTVVSSVDPTLTVRLPRSRTCFSSFINAASASSMYTKHLLWLPSPQTTKSSAGYLTAFLIREAMTWLLSGFR